LQKGQPVFLMDVWAEKSQSTQRTALKWEKNKYTHTGKEPEAR